MDKKINSLGVSATKKPWWSRGSVTASGALIFIAISGVAIWFLPSRLINAWSPEKPSGDNASGGGVIAISNTPTTAAQVVILTLGGIVGVLGVALSMSRHGDERLEAERDQQRLEAERITERRNRFATLVSLLAEDDKPLSRISALHGLSTLANDWMRSDNKIEANVCANIVTAYLRSPMPHTDIEAEDQVRDTAIQILRNHLLDGAEYTWSDFNISLSSAPVRDRWDLSDIVLRDNAVLNLRHINVRNGGGLDLDNITLLGDAQLILDHASFGTMSRSSIDHARVTGSASLSMRSARVHGDAYLEIPFARVSGAGQIDLSTLSVSDKAVFKLFGLRAFDKSEVCISLLRSTRRTHVDFDSFDFADESTLHRDC